MFAQPLRSSSPDLYHGKYAASLFASGEQGAWYDPSDLTTMFQDAAGTTPVTGVEQPVGRILDKSGRGNHATQTTTASRPVLSARVNLLTNTEAFAAWSMVGSSTTRNTTATTDPLGGNSADILVASASSGEHYVHGSSNGVLGINYTVSVYAKAREYTVLRLGSGLIGANAYFNLAAGTVISPSDGSASIKSIGDGWYQCYLTKPAVTSSTLWGIIIGPAVTNNTQYTGDGVSGIYLWGADLRVANESSNLPSYQRVNTATDYDTQGFPLYLRFDGVDDSLVTPTVNFTATDKMTVFAGVRKLSDAIGMVVELSANISFNNGSFYLVTGLDSLAAYDTTSSRGTAPISVNQRASFTGPNSPETYVIAATHDIAGDLSTARKNGTAGASGTGDKGAGNYGNYPLYIGRRGGTSIPFNGRLYGLIVRGAQTDNLHLTNVERFLAHKSGVLL